MVWFNYNKETDWRIDNNETNLAAFRDNAFGEPLDVTPPTGTININDGARGTKTTAVTLNLTGVDTGSGLSQMRFQNEGGSWSSWENYDTIKSWTLTSSPGTKRVYFQLKDGADNVSSPVSDTIKLRYPRSKSKGKG